MKNNIESAITLLKNGGYTCVLCKDDITYTSTERGVLPLIRFIDEKKDLTGFSAADKIVGKATAYLYILAGVKEVYAQVMSTSALLTLDQYGIKASYDTLVKEIVNRMGTGICPMEQAVSDIDVPEMALAAVKEKLAQLKAHKQAKS